MAGKRIRWTEQQRRAIEQRGSDVLVTASAGTGKTAVLSGRCVDIVRDKNICPDVWSILVLTFTDAAAEQMRSRIAEQLEAAIAEGAERHLRHQLILLGGADIGTIHSFCKRLITEYFYKLGLDPMFRVIDADEQRLLKAEVLEKTVDWAWGQSHLAQGLEQLLDRRDLRANDGFLSRIIGLSDFLEGVVSRQNWYQRARVLAEMVNPLAAELGERQRQIVAGKLEHIINQLRGAQKLYDKHGDGDWVARCEEIFIGPVARCIEFLRTEQPDRCAEEIRDFVKPRVTKPKEVPEVIAALIQKTVREAIEDFKGLGELAVLNPEYLDRVSGASSLQTKVLVELVRKFEQLYGQAKRSVNCLDFADLEHYALELLVSKESSEDKLSPSETALAVQGKYRYIFVDEYQDINRVQQAILDMLRGKDNVFVVGDVKQSIYAFRGAEPEIFNEQLKSASADPENAPMALRVDLTANWRSAKGILDFVNKLFGQLMTASFVDIDYDRAAMLTPGIERERAGNDPAVELHILDEKSTGQDLQEPEAGEHAGDGDIFSSRQRQAAMIAQRIRQMVGAEGGEPEFGVYDTQTGEERPVEYRDIVVLMRSLAKKANDYVEVFRLVGVPVSCEAAAGYFEATEIRGCLCLLKVLDNPQRDIELAAVLRSPFFKVSDTELAKVRLHSRAEQVRGFFDCVMRYCTSGPDEKLAVRLKEILAEIEQWRGIARQGGLADLIWRIYRQTGYLSFVSGLPGGQVRRANLLKLHERAIQFEGFASSTGLALLRRFVEFIEKLEAAGEQWAAAEPDSSVENAVRIISVHKSKGLEFPVVFLAELDSRFNTKDIYADVLADADYTLGLQVIDRKSNTKLSSLAHQIIAEEKLGTLLAEEMRILYVATTRARERLVLSACEKRNHCRDIISNGFLLGAEAVADWQLRQCRGSLEWILYALCDRKGLHEAFETGLAGGGDSEDLFGIKLYGQAELEELSRYILKLKRDKAGRVGWVAKGSKPKKGEGKLLSAVKESLAWQYRFTNAPFLPAKQSVTELSHRDDEYVRMDYSKALQRRPRAVVSGDLAQVVGPRLVGMATHLVISGLDLSAPVTAEAIEKTKERLLADGAITEAVAERINCGSIMGFFESELGRTVLDSRNSVWCEWPFTFALPAEQGCGDDTIIVQGIIDMLVRGPEGLLVIDFKTDNISAGEVGERAELYREQLELYGRAAEVILKEKVLGKWLYFLWPGCAVEVR